MLQLMNSFWENNGLTNLTKQPTCYKNLSKPTCIGLILPDVPRSFQIICEIETRLSNFHMMTLTVMREGFKRFQRTVEI